MTDIAMHGHGVRGMKPETLHSFDGIGDPGKLGGDVSEPFAAFCP